ncbi:MAG: hypothetical protein KUG73_00085 [Pseudomonadales bacterium]|nr:hypothetical protein [Pseudomonadales bacterium]
MIKNDLEKQVTLEKLQKLTASLYLSLAAQVAIAIVMGTYLRDKTSDLHFTILAVAFFTLLIGCLIVGALYHRDQKNHKIAQYFDHYMHLATFFSFALGAFWSSVALSQLHAPLNQQVILVLILLGQTAASVLSLAPNIRLFYAGVPISLVPLGVGFIWLNDQVHTLLGALLLLFFIFITYVAHAVNKLVTESIRLRLINDTLLIDKSQLLASASHDLRQPLHALALYISALEQNKSTDQKIITKIKYTIQSLQSLFDGLLDLSKLDANASEPKIQNVLWCDLKRQLHDEFIILAKQKDINIYWTDQNECFASDPLLLEQIIRNLVGNAIQYTQNGSVTLSCSKNPKQPDKVHVNITDTGIGIETHNQTDIFNAYCSIKTPHSNTKNPGLGLSIAQRLAIAMGHELSLSSQHGQGSCFSISLNKGTTKNIQTKRYLNENQQELAGILLIDNDMSNTTQQLLRSWGCNVFCANTLTQAAEYITEEGFIPDAVIINTPVISSNSNTIIDDNLTPENSISSKTNTVSECKAISLIQSLIPLQYSDNTIPIMILVDSINKNITEPNQYRIKKDNLKPAILRAFVINIRGAKVSNNVPVEHTSLTSKTLSMQKA